MNYKDKYLKYHSNNSKEKNIEIDNIDYKYLYLKYKKKYITLKNSNLFTNQNNNIINKTISLLEKINYDQNNFSINGIPCIGNEKCNKTGIFKRLGSHNINNRLEPCEGWNCI